MRKVNYTDRHLYHEFLTTRLGILSYTYTDTSIDKLIFEYFNREGIADDERSLVNLVDYTETKFNFNTMQFPLTMNPHHYGRVKNVDTPLKNDIVYHVMDGDQPIRIHWIGPLNQQIVHYQGFMDFKFKDTKINDNLLDKIFNLNKNYPDLFPVPKKRK